MTANATLYPNIAHAKGSLGKDGYTWGSNGFNYNSEISSGGFLAFTTKYYGGYCCNKGSVDNP